jgi:hypothetical protein
MPPVIILPPKTRTINKTMMTVPMMITTVLVLAVLVLFMRLLSLAQLDLASRARHRRVIVI